jgi:hypothetical protein
MLSWRNLARYTKHGHSLNFESWQVRRAHFCVSRLPQHAWLPLNMGGLRFIISRGLRWIVMHRLSVDLVILQIGHAA